MKKKIFILFLSLSQIVGSTLPQRSQHPPVFSDILFCDLSRSKKWEQDLCNSAQLIRELILFCEGDEAIHAFIDAIQKKYALNKNLFGKLKSLESLVLKGAFGSDGIFLFSSLFEYTPDLKKLTINLIEADVNSFELIKSSQTIMDHREQEGFVILDLEVPLALQPPPLLSHLTRNVCHLYKLEQLQMILPSTRLPLVDSHMKEILKIILLRVFLKYLSITNLPIIAAPKEFFFLKDLEILEVRSAETYSEVLKGLPDPRKIPHLKKLCISGHLLNRKEIDLLIQALGNRPKIIFLQLNTPLNQDLERLNHIFPKHIVDLIIGDSVLRKS